MLQIRFSSSENDAEIYNDDAYDSINIMKHEIFKTSDVGGRVGLAISGLHV